MNSPLINKDLLNQGTPLDSVILTPNERIARKLIQAAQWEDGERKEFWESPSVQSLNDWILECWAHLQGSCHPVASTKVLLSTLELTNVWARVISNDPSYSSILNGLELASMAVSASRTVELWEAKPQSFVPDSIETERFLAWNSQVASTCAAKGWVSFETVISLVIAAVDSGDVPLPGELKLVGFDETPPLVERLFKTLSGKCLLLVDANVGNDASGCTQKLEVGERRDQAQLAARWAKAHLDSNLDQRIAIICPELSKTKDQVATAFKKVFEPQGFMLDSPRYTPPFNISAGDPLAHAPVVNSILQWVMAPGKKLDINQVEALITSPFLAGSSTERVSRIRFVKRLKRSRLQKIELFGLLGYVDTPPILAELLSKMSLKYQSCPAMQNLSQWAFWVNDVSSAIGWPGERTVDSEEYQAIQQWNVLLDQYSSLEKIYGGCSDAKAVSLLSQCANDLVFKPESHDSPIQILGTLEAAGLRFDKVWIMDMNDDIWPPAPSPSPFLPLDVQKDMDMPHASAERELDFAQRIYQRMISSGDEVVLSYAAWDEDRELRQSALIDDVTAINSTDLNCSDVVRYDRIIRDAVPTETVDDRFVPIESRSVKGGAGIFTSQSQCPFQAFAKYRLKAGEPTEDQPGLTPAERGKIIHDALDEFWKHIGTQEELISLGDDVLKLHISEAVDHAMFLLKNAATTLSKTVLEIEKERTIQLLEQWLVFERSRSPFSVLEREKTIEMEVGGLNIKVRVDRVDHVNGSRISIDYKSGRAEIRDWVGYRPDNLQMPIYSLIEDTDGVAIASLRKDDVKMKGIIATDSVDGLICANELPERLNMPTGWDQIKSEWKEVLDNLGKEFAAGVNNVSPTRASNCRYCPYEPICRKPL